MSTDNKDYKGYPHYPASEDITRRGNNNGKTSLDEGTPQQVQAQKNQPAVTGDDADITSDDIWALESSGQNMDTADGRNLINSSLDTTDDDGDPLNEPGSMMSDVSGSDLDVPGNEDDDDQVPGEEDEENNFYSLGGDNHEDQEENKGE